MKFIKYSVNYFIKLILVNFLLLVLFLEVGSRLFLWQRRDASLTKPNSVALFYYPEIKPTENVTTSIDEWDILLLGASVLNPAWGSVEKEIESVLQRTISIPFRIHNMGIPAHTSRDSLIKYTLLQGKRFDKIFIYHGINEIRMNNYPRKQYKSDYSHIHWYRTVNPIIRHPELGYWATPFTLEHALFKITTANNDEQFEDLKYGKNIKTKAAIAANLSSIAEIAMQRDEDLILSTFAFHLPSNYSKENFLNHKLDCNKHSLPVEVWGYPENVAENIDVHNNTIREVAKAYNLNCIELSDLIPKNKANFDDACHLTSAGSHLLAQAIVPQLLP